jgi:hypothetical protein
MKLLIGIGLLDSDLKVQLAFVPFLLHLYLIFVGKHVQTFSNV